MARCISMQLACVVVLLAMIQAIASAQVHVQEETGQSATFLRRLNEESSHAEVSTPDANAPPVEASTLSTPTQAPDPVGAPVAAPLPAPAPVPPAAPVPGAPPAPGNAPVVPPADPNANANANANGASDFQVVIKPPQRTFSSNPKTPMPAPVVITSQPSSEYVSKSTKQMQKLQEMIIICILGSVAVIGLVVFVISRKIYKDTAEDDDEFMRANVFHSISSTRRRDKDELPM